MDEVKKILESVLADWSHGATMVYSIMIRVQEALELLKKQGNLVDVDKLREKLGFAESCDKCKKDSWKCSRDTYFSEKDFCERLDIAIEELIKEGR